MKLKAFLFAGAVSGLALAGWFVQGCGTQPQSQFGDDASTPDDDSGTTDPDADPFQNFDGGDTDGAHPCVGLECQQVSCGGGSATTVSGYVYDPGGKRPLYNVYVYVPNAPLAAITTGPVCTACQAPASGSPLVSATTDAKGHFQITDVPVGTNIPLVLQLGKWRRHLTLPQVKQCTDNTYNTKKSLSDNTLETFMRLPKKNKESSPDDSLPLIALTTGCDFGECFLRNTIGIDASEFTGPNGSGRVHLFRGHDDGQQLPGTPGNAYTDLWENKGNLNKYDIVYNSCECTTYDRGTGYANMKDYLDNGGRFFGTHYHYNFFASQAQCVYDNTCKGPSDMASVAQWLGGGYQSSPYYIYTGTQQNPFPKGKAMADWLDNINKAVGDNTPYGQLKLYDIRDDVAMVTQGKATPWIYSGSTPFKGPYQTFYLSWNAPVNSQVDKQCGRAVFSDVHLSGSSFSGFCNATNPNDGHHVDETALEFLFFDLSSCVQDDSKPPPPPPPN